jgi:hypothetical protein
MYIAARYLSGSHHVSEIAVNMQLSEYYFEHNHGSTSAAMAKSAEIYGVSAHYSPPPIGKRRNIFGFRRLCVIKELRTGTIAWCARHVGGVNFAP